MNEDLAKRAVACKHWRWMPGMLIYNADGPVRIDAVDGTQPGLWRNCRFTNEVYVANVHSGPRPDLTDPATLGCVLALVRKAWGDPQVHAAPLCGMKNNHVNWRIWLGRDLTLYFDGDTEAEALLAALEAAP